MQKTEILEKLTLLLAGGYKKTDIERNCNLPKNSLSSVMTGVKEMPNKWVEKFGEYFEKLEVKTTGISLPADYVEVGKVMAIRSHGFHDITCSADPAKPMGCEGCSCEMYKRAKKAESEVQTLKIELEWRDKIIETLTEQVEDPNKPLPAPPTKKPAESTLNQEKGKEGAENGFKPTSINMEGGNNFQQPIQSPNYKELLAELTGNQPPEGLTEIQLMVWKNDQKRKTQPKSAPITEFGVTKKEKK